MDLTFGTNVREYGYSIGRLTGIEADTTTGVVHNILVGGGETAGARSEKRPRSAVPVDHFAGDIVLHPHLSAGEPSTPAGALILTDATRVMRDGRQIGRLSGLELSPESGRIVAIAGRQHWWTRRFRFEVADLDFSVRGEVRVGAATTRAA